MERRRRVLAGIAALGALAAACGRDATPGRRAQIGPDDWAPTPQIDSVEIGPRGLHIVGRAAPGGRVVLRSEAGAYAAVADAEGVYDVMLQPPATASLFLIEAQLGQDARAAPTALAVAPGGRGPIVLVSPGAASERLDGAGGGLDGVDRDGGQAVAFGRASPGADISVDAGEGKVRVRTGADGRWRARLPATAPGDALTLRVDGGGFVAPAVASGAQAPDFVMSRQSGGWVIVRRYGAQTVQTTWLPDRVQTPLTVPGR